MSPGAGRIIGVLVVGSVVLGFLYAAVQFAWGQGDLVTNFTVAALVAFLGLGLPVGGVRLIRWSSKLLSREAQRIVAIVSVLVCTVVGVAVLYAVIQFFRGQQNIDTNLVNGLLFVFIGLAVFVIVAPTVVRLYQEDLAEGAEMKSEEWMTRLRTLITVSLTIVLLVFALTWFFSPEKLQVAPTSTAGNATTGSNMTTLHPFVQAFVGLYTVVIAFYFPTAAAQSIATIWKDHKQANGNK